MRIFFLLAITLIAVACGCERQGESVKAIQMSLTELKIFPQQNWDILAGKKIYFGHQSVGLNIINGISEIMRDLPNIKLNLQETNQPESFNQPIFAHSQVGKNLNPISKCDDFKRVMENGVGDKADLAFFKFCYVDINKDTDVDSVFRYYVQTISYLKEKYPKVIFIHFTVPLTVVPNDSIPKIIKLFKTNSQVELNNVRRNDFNKLLKEKFDKEGLVFDLARYESTDINGNEKFFEIQGNKYPSLLPEYSYDGGHLNEVGKVIITKYFLTFLTRVVNNNLVN